MTEAQKRAQRNYFAKTKQYVFRVNKETEPELCMMLDKVNNRSAYIKGLVRKDMEARGLGEAI